MSAAKGKRATILTGSHDLTTSPTNLKEAIDWILRITNQDGLENSTGAAANAAATSSTGTGGVAATGIAASGVVPGGGVVAAAASNTDKKVCICQLAEAVRDLFRNVDQQLEPWEKKLVDDIVSQIRDVGGTHHLKELIYRLGYGLSKFVRGDDKGTDGKPNGIINQTGYKSHYKSGSTLKEVSKNASDLMTCAKILMGAIPLVFSGLSYLYWLCSGGKGGKSRELYHYVERMGYSWDYMWTKQSQEADLNPLIGVFETCKVLGNAVTLSSSSTNSMSFAAYLDQLRQKTTEDADEVKKKLNENALVKLNILCSGYFRSLHTVDQLRKREPRMPRTVREILYWLTSLPYCPVYRVLISKIKDMIRRVGDNGKITFNGNGTSCEITVENSVTYLQGGALVAPMVLLTIQDTIECRVGKDEKTNMPPAGQLSTDSIAIHDLYANTLFEFRFPMSETESYYLLQDCLVALFYQLYFLQQQCGRGLGSGYGWTACRYGEGVNCTDCKSWICSASTNGKAHSIDSSSECGKKDKNKASPLQAFLCDCLPGFTCPVVVKSLEENKDKLTTKPNVYLSCYPEVKKHLEHSNDKPGSECPIPMGFRGCFKGAAALGAGGSGSAGSAVGGKGGSGAASSSNCVGLGIRGALKFYAHDDISESALYQLVRCICSLTRRVPRSTGTIYGFFYGLGGMSSTTPGKGVSKVHPVASALKVEMECCPGWRNPTCLMGALYNWRGSSGDDHPETGGNHTKLSLFSLTGCNGGGDKTANTTTCGKYLYPLTGSLYNSVAPEFCDTYISWMVYLTGVLKTGLESLLKEFLEISCADCKCEKGDTCEKQGCKPGQHGKTDGSTTTSNCCCPNIVDCVGVHGTFYRFGFLFNSPNMLTGKEKGNPNGLRKCSQFHQQLEAVIGGELFDNLFKQIYRFLYTTRALFGLYIGVYWLAVLLYLLWSMTVNLDLLHIQSHWRSPRSYLVPLQRLMADGSRKGFCTLGYFQDSGDRLLSQGVNDLYL